MTYIIIYIFSGLNTGMTNMLVDIISDFPPQS